eukprot:366274-Chlamydomonas_euryale.AAC.3
MLLCECRGCVNCRPILRGEDACGCSCYRAFHLSCLSPPLKQVPRGLWMCPPCASMASATAAAAIVEDSSSGGHGVGDGGGDAGSVGDGGDLAPGAAENGGVAVAECVRCEEHADNQITTADTARGSRGSTVTRSGRQTKRPNFMYFMHLCYICAIGSQVSPQDTVVYTANSGDPVTIEQALSGPDAAEWQHAIDAEMTSLIGMGTFEFVDKPLGWKLIPVKWVFKQKFDAFGLLEKYKARLCAKGFN